MKTENLIKLKSWQLNPDNYGSKFKNLDDNIIAAELKKAKLKKNIITYNSIKIFLNHLFEKKYFDIPKCKEFKITYKSIKLNKIEFVIEENNNIYEFCYILPPSKEWISKKIKINDLIRCNINRSVPDLRKITGFIFNMVFQIKSENPGVLYIKKFIIKGYEVITLNNGKYSGYTHYLLRKGLLNNFKAISQNKKQQNNIMDFKGNPLYCIYPFYQYRINREFLTVCCDIHINDNVDFNNNKNLLDVWCGEKFNKIREGIKDLSYSGCNFKKCIQFNTNRESFKNLETIKKEYPDIADYIEGKTEKFIKLPYYIVAGFDNTCNLACRSCNVNKVKNQSIEAGKKYIKQIEDIGENVERILIAGYGDPFASPIYRKWLYNFDDKKFPKLKKIEIMTNAILWTENNWNKISNNIKKYDIDAVISIDGATKKTYEYNRTNAKFGTLLKNLKFISNLRKKNTVNSLALCFVIQKNNYKEMPLIIDFAKKYSFDGILFNQITNWGAYTKNEFRQINIFNKKHPEYKNFKKIYEDIKRNRDGIFKIYFGFKL